MSTTTCNFDLKPHLLTQFERFTPSARELFEIYHSQKGWGPDISSQQFSEAIGWAMAVLEADSDHGLSSDIATDSSSSYIQLRDYLNELECRIEGER